MLSKKLSTTLFSVALSLALLGAVSVNANDLKVDSPEHKSEVDFQIQMAVAKSSKAWKDAFNSGNAAAAAALYEDDAIMIVKPFGTFTGKKEILAFWTDLVSKGFDDVVYSKTIMTVLDNKSARVSAEWKMNNAHGIITNELWVIQPAGHALLKEDYFEVAK